MFLENVAGMFALTRYLPCLSIFHDVLLIFYNIYTISKDNLPYLIKDKNEALRYLM